MSCAKQHPIFRGADCRFVSTSKQPDLLFPSLLVALLITYWLRQSRAPSVLSCIAWKIETFLFEKQRMKKINQEPSLVVEMQM